METAVFSARAHDRRYLDAANQAAGSPHRLAYHCVRLNVETAALAARSDAVLAFANDCLDAAVLRLLRRGATRFVALRSAGFDNVDLAVSAKLGIKVGHVPAYSPHAVAEHAVALLLALVRHLPRAHARVRDGNFALEGLLGFDLHGRTVAIIGTGRIGMAAASILVGFGCRLLGCDPRPNPDFPGSYMALKDALAAADIVTLHCPLTAANRHLIGAATIRTMRPGVALINTSRGAVIDTAAVIEAMKSGQIGRLGLDVYEHEHALFFEDWSDSPIQDDVFARLMTFPNVLITGHQGFFTDNALRAIAKVTLANLSAFESGGEAIYPVSLPTDERVAIARALANDPALVLGDEPTGDLDSRNSARVVTELRRLAHEGGRAVICVTHDLAIAAEADIRIEMLDGRITKVS